MTPLLRLQGRKHYGVMEMKKFLLGAAVAATALFAAISVQAASLSVIGGANGVLSGFDLNASTGLSDGDGVKVFTNGSGGGLTLSGAPTDVTFEYLGSEAGAKNRAVENENGTTMFRNYDPDSIFGPLSASSIGDTVVVNVASDGFVPFEFGTKTIGVEIVCFGPFFCFPFPVATDETATNGGTIAGALAIALFQESSTSVIALFGDGAGDLDYDDMAMRISVTVVPLPPAVLLFGGALIGLGWLARRRKLAS